jgi:hypothetical protein
MPTNRTKRTRKARGDIHPFDLAMITGGPLPATLEKWYCDKGRVLDPWSKGLLWGIRPLAEVWEAYHGKPLTEGDAETIRARWPEIEAEQAARFAALPPEKRLPVLEHKHSVAAADASPCRHHVGMTDAEKAAAEERRAAAEVERDRLAVEIADLRARLKTPGSDSPSNWPDAESAGFTPIARLENDDDE